MRFISCLIAIHVCRGQVCSDSFGGDSDSWMRVFVRCAGTKQLITELFSKEELWACVDDLGDGGVAGLISYLSDWRTTGCVECVLDLANGLLDLFVCEAIRETCVDQSSPGVWEMNDVKYGSVECERNLRVIRDAFNACADNGADVWTGTSVSGCTVAEFREFATVHNPYEQLAHAAMGSAMSVSEAYASAGLLHAVLYQISPTCKTLFDGFLGTLEVITALAGDSECFANGEPIPLDPACLANVDILSLLSQFESGSGFSLVTLESRHCTNLDEIDFINSTLRPFRALVQCSVYSDFANQTFCFGARSSFYQIFDSEWISFSCFTDLMAEMHADLAVREVCLTDPFSDLCVTVMNLLGGPLYNFSICAGFALETVSTVCSIHDPPIYDYGPIVACGLFATVSKRHACISTILPVNDQSCLSCYWNLLNNIYLINRANPLLAVICRNPYKKSCYNTLTGNDLFSDPFFEFKTCSGISIERVSRLVCTTDEFAKFGPITQYVFGSDTLTSALYSFEAYIKTESMADLPCVWCFHALIKAGFELSQTDENTCETDLFSIECSLVFGEAMETFAACSGNAFTGS